MRRTAMILLAAALAAGSLAVEGEDLTDHPCYDAETEQLVYPEQQVWFHEGDTKFGNLDEAPHPFDTTPPDASVQAGAGAGQYSGAATQGAGAGDPTGQGVEPYQNVWSTFSGTFEGCIDTLLVDLYSFDPTNRTSTGEATAGNPGGLRNHTVALRVNVDGYDVLSIDIGEVATEFANEGLGPNLNRFSVNLGQAVEAYAGFYEDLTLGGEHTVTIKVAPWYVNTGHSVYVWDTIEVPSGMTFNGEVTDAYPAIG